MFERFRWLGAQRASSGSSTAAVHVQPVAVRPPPARVTRREIEILPLLARATPIREIWPELFKSALTSIARWYYP